MLRKLFLSLMVAGSFAFPLGSAAEAAIADSPFVSANHVAHVAPVEDVNFIWGGRAFCWYPNGWNGPGFYQCGFAWRTGIGWGGPWGWNGWGGGWRAGWNGHGWHRGMTVHHHHHHNRPGHRPPHNRPGHGNNRPGHGNNRPGHGNNRPGHGNNRPGHGNNRPGHGNNRPGHGNNRPGHGGRPGGGGGGRPGGGNRPHSGGNRGGGNRGGGQRRTELPNQLKIVATATFDYASAGAAPYQVIVS